VLAFERDHGMVHVVVDEPHAMTKRAQAALLLSLLALPVVLLTNDYTGKLVCDHDGDATPRPALNMSVRASSARSDGTPSQSPGLFNTIHLPVCRLRSFFAP
jgi:hypothetical protein